MFYDSLVYTLGCGYVHASVNPSLEIKIHVQAYNCLQNITAITQTLSLCKIIAILLYFHATPPKPFSIDLHHRSASTGNQTSGLSKSFDHEFGVLTSRPTDHQFWLRKISYLNHARTWLPVLAEKSWTRDSSQFLYFIAWSPPPQFLFNSFTSFFILLMLQVLLLRGSCNTGT